MPGASSWQLRPVSEQAEAPRSSRLRIRHKYDHSNQRRMPDLWADADEHERKREGRIEYEGEGKRQGFEGIERTGSPRDVGRSRTVDAATHNTAQMLGGSVASDAVDPIEKPSGESHERGRTAVPWGGAGSGRTEKERFGTAALPCLRGFPEGGKGLSGSSDAAPRHGPGLEGLHDEIGTSFFETWWKDQ